MTIRGRVDVYCTDLPGPTFIAVASSTELNDSGRPAVVRIVEFMATDPLYKATRIGDFGDFEFRATELHDDVMTLAQVQQLWNQVPADARWWPVKPYGFIPLRSADLIYATLGPMATYELMQALLSSPDNKSESIERLIEGLRDAIGRRPIMLIALAASLGAAQRYEMRRFDGQELQRHESGVGRFLGESLKHLGGLVLEASQQFGLDEDQFGPWFESQMHGLFDQSQWPPTQVPYTLDGPALNAVAQRPGSELSEIDEPALLEERRKIQEWLEQNSGITTSVYGKQGPDAVPSTFSARSWARLVSATVQAMHVMLSDPGSDRTALGENEMFIYYLCESISSLPASSWKQLTNSRHICFVADLGELLMIVGELGGGDITGRAAVALANACDNDSDLISIAEQAGQNLPYRNGRWDFNWGIEFVRNYQPSN
jgi:hypothetical protein